ncbi:hypothetical protein MMC28_008524 [Mycoblastus sanguinarius]|nr:hypothetical protein [Mycoblastus sanguinarius]
MFCDQFPDVTEGQVYNTTIAYAPDALSTMYFPDYPYVPWPGTQVPTWGAINYTQLQLYGVPQPLVPDPAVTNIQWLSLPPDLSAINAEFQTCWQSTLGAVDPPRTLGPATALVPSVTSAAPSPVASPGAQPSPAHVPATLAPTPKIPSSDPPQSIPLTDPKASGSPKSNPPNADPGQAKSDGLPSIDPGGSPSGENEASGSPNETHLPPANSADGGDSRQDSGSDEDGLLPEAPNIPPIQTASTPFLSASSGRVIDGQQVEPAPGDGLVTGGTTLRPGDQTTLGGFALSIGSNAILIDGTTNAIPIATAPASADSFLFNGESITRALGGGISIDGSSVPIEGQATVSGHTISAASSSVVIDGTSYPLAMSVGAVLQLPGTNSVSFTLANGLVVTAGGPPAIFFRLDLLTTNGR